MANWQFELWIAQNASDEYVALSRLADAAVPDLGPLPVNRDPRLRLQLASVDHFERTRSLLRSIRNPADCGLDRGLFGPAHFVRYRTEGTTFVYFTRIETTPPAVLVYAFSNAPLDALAIRKLVESGNAHLLERYGLPALPLGDASGFVN